MSYTKEEDLRDRIDELERTVNTLCAELIKDGRVSPSAIREELPSKNRDEIVPPWIRNGYDSKQAWLDDRDGRDNGGEA